MNPGKKRLAGIMSLAKGTIVAQLVFVLATPILTRIYSAEDIGVFGLYTALVLIMSRLASLRYELAIPLPRQDRTAINLVLLTTLVTVSILVVSYLGYTIFTHSGGLPVDKHVLHNYAVFIVLGVGTFVINETVIFWFIRKKEFGIIASARVINAVGLAILQLLGYFSASKLVFLIASYPVALLVSIGFLLSKIDLTLFEYRKRRLKLLETLSLRYRDFPMYSTLSTALFELSQALPLFVLTYFFGNHQAGFFFLARRIGLMPISLIGRAISQVNHADMLEHHKSRSLGAVMLQQIHNLQWISIVPAFVLAYFAPRICEFIFGAEWRIAGVFLQLLTPYVVVRFVFSPLMAINHVAEWQKSGFWFEIASSAISAAFLIGFSWLGNAIYAVAGYFSVLCIANLAYRVFLMKRLDVGAIPLLWPGIVQLTGIAGIVVLIHALQ
jgi:O-antigen/teichoic acid export membrane protein